ncbi:MAG: Myb-like DNA-binding domain-containing protein [Cetobacterium sp.]
MSYTLINDKKGDGGMMTIKVMGMRVRRKTVNDISKSLKIDKAEVIRILAERGDFVTLPVQWSEQEEDVLVTMRAQGKSFSSIGKELGRTMSSVHKRWTKISLKTQNKERD